MITDIVGLLRKGEIEAAYKHIEALLTDIVLLIEQEGKGEIIQENNNVVSQMKNIISEIKTAMHHNDIIYLVDLLNYELKPYIHFDN